MTCEVPISAPAEIIEETEFVVVDGNGSSEAPVIAAPIELEEIPGNKAVTFGPFEEDPETGIWHHTGIRSPKGENEGSGDNIDYAPAIRGSQRARVNRCRPHGR